MVFGYRLHLFLVTCFESLNIIEFADVERGEVANVVKLGIIESFNVKLCMLLSAAEAAEQVSSFVSLGI